MLKIIRVCPEEGKKCHNFFSTCCTRPDTPAVLTDTVPIVCLLCFYFFLCGRFLELAMRTSGPCGANASFLEGRGQHSVHPTRANSQCWRLTAMCTPLEYDGYGFFTVSYPCFILFFSPQNLAPAERLSTPLPLLLTAIGALSRPPAHMINLARREDR